MGGFGAYGKMPALGDFLRIALPGSFVAPWDRWLQDRIAQVRTDLGTRWQGCYMSAPIWRFTLSAGVAGPMTVLGALMPSVDRVGRQFPLTAAAIYPAGLSAVAMHLHATARFEALEDILLDALSDRMTPQQLTDRLKSVSLGAPLPTVSMSGAGGALALRGTQAADLGPALATQAVAARSRAPTVWSTALERDARLMLVDGLPDRDAMGRLFDLDAPDWADNAARQGPAS